MSIWRLFATQHWEVPLLIRLQKIGVYHTYPHTVSPFLPNFVIVLTERRPSVLYFKPFRSLSTYTRCRQTSPNWAGSALAAGCHAHTRTTSILNEDACKLWSTPDCVGPKLYCFPIPSWWASQSSDVEVHVLSVRLSRGWHLATQPATWKTPAGHWMIVNLKIPKFIWPSNKSPDFSDQHLSRVQSTFFTQCSPVDTRTNYVLRPSFLLDIWGPQDIDIETVIMLWD